MLNLKLMSKTAKKSRFVTLDVLRGYFMLVIIVDHLNRFPSWFAWITGQGRLWISAGEGFFIISGLLVGYTRGFKKRNASMRHVTGLLYKRAAILYASSVVASSLLLILTLHAHFPVALQPSVVVPRNSLSTAIYQILTLHYVFEWVYFLKFYIAAFLIAPLFVWLLRKGQTILTIVLAFAVWLLGYHIKQDWLQWQVLFFVPAAFGFHLESIRSWWRQLSHQRRHIAETVSITFSVLTLAISSFWVFGWDLVEGPHAVLSFDRYVAARRTIDPLFSKVQLSLGRILLSLVCFVGIYFLFDKLWPRLQRYTAWLFLPFGENSLVAYIIHGFIILPMQVFAPITTSSTFNTLLALAAVLVVFTLSRVELVRRFVPR